MLQTQLINKLNRKQALAWVRENSQRLRAGGIFKDAFSGALLTALADPRSTVSRAAAEALLNRNDVSHAKLLDIFQRTNLRHVRLHTLSLLARGERISSLISLLCACCWSKEDAQVRQAAIRHIRAWGNYWPKAPREMVFRLATALSSAQQLLPQDLALELWLYVYDQTGFAPEHVRERLNPPRRQRPIYVEPERRQHKPQGEPPTGWVLSGGDPFVVSAPPVPAPPPTPWWSARTVRKRYELPPCRFAWLRRWL